MICGCLGFGERIPALFPACAIILLICRWDKPRACREVNSWPFAFGPFNCDNSFANSRVIGTILIFRPFPSRTTITLCSKSMSPDSSPAASERRNPVSASKRTNARSRMFALARISRLTSLAVRLYAPFGNWVRTASRLGRDFRVASCVTTKSAFFTCAISPIFDKVRQSNCLSDHEELARMSPFS